VSITSQARKLCRDRIALTVLVFTTSSNVIGCSTGKSADVAFQMAEVAIPRQMFQEILRLIAELRPQPPPALA
jgi:hypothetical protein